MLMRRVAKTVLKNYSKCFSVKKPDQINYYSIANFPNEILQLKDSVRKFTNDKVAPLADDCDKKNYFPQHLWKEMGNLGLLGVTTAAKYGGSELSHIAHAMIMEEISRASGAIGLSYGAHSALCLGQIERHGTEEIKLKYLPKLCSGEHVGALAMSEPNSGSDVVSMKTTAVKSGKKWILNGTKMWITNGPEANVFVIYAKTDLKARAQGITAFVLEKNTPGFKQAQKLDKFGMRGSQTCELTFEDVEIPEENILGQVNQGVNVLMNGLNYERVILSAGPVGIMQSCLDYVLPYLQTREQFNKKIGTFQLMQGKLADMFTAMQASRSYLYQVCHTVDSGLINNVDSASLILFCSTQCEKVTNEGIQALGGNGYINEFPTGRFFRDAKLYSIGAGTNEIRRWLIGRDLFSFGTSSY